MCEAFGISRQAYYAARKVPTNDEPAEPLRRRPERRGLWVSDATLVEKIREVVVEFPAWGVRKVWAYLRRLGTVVSRKRVWKRMNALGLTLLPISEREQPLRRGHVVVPLESLPKAENTMPGAYGTVAANGVGLYYLAPQLRR